MIQDTLQRVFTENYAMLIIFTVVLVAIRIAYLIVNKKEFIFYKELFLLTFVVYSICLFYVVTFEDNNYGTNNFIPFGFFVSSIIKSKKPFAIISVSLICSLTIELTQYLIGRTFDIDDIILNLAGCTLGYLVYLIIELIESKIPLFQKNYIKNILVILFIIMIALIYYKTSLWGILR